MFNKKTKLKLTDFECNLLINGMNEFRNMLLSDGILSMLKNIIPYIVLVSGKFAHWTINIKRNKIKTTVKEE